MRSDFFFWLVFVAWVCIVHMGFSAFEPVLSVSLCVLRHAWRAGLISSLLLKSIVYYHVQISQWAIASFNPSLAQIHVTICFTISTSL